MRIKKKIKSGIYKITNLVNGKFYIGSANNIYARWKGHKTSLRSKTKNHHSIHFQRAWDKHGEKNFVFEIIELVENFADDKKILKRCLLDREQHYLDTLTPWDRKVGYNFDKVAGSSLGRKMKKKTKKLLSIAAKKQENNAFRRTGDDAVNAGRLHTKEWCDDMSIRFSGENNPFYKKTHTEEVRKNISKNNTGKPLGEENPFSKLKEKEVEEIIKYFHAGIYNQMELEKMYQTDQTNISLIVRGKTWKKVYERVMKEITENKN